MGHTEVVVIAITQIKEKLFVLLEISLNLLNININVTISYKSVFVKLKIKMGNCSFRADALDHTESSNISHI